LFRLLPGGFTKAAPSKLRTAAARAYETRHRRPAHPGRHRSLKLARPKIDHQLDSITTDHGSQAGSSPQHPSRLVRQMITFTHQDPHITGWGCDR